MNQLNRYEFVGSFLRPERLKEARKNYELNNITKEELTKVEDECIVELVNKLKELVIILSQMVNLDVLLGI